MEFGKASNTDATIRIVQTLKITEQEGFRFCHYGNMIFKRFMTMFQRFRIMAKKVIQSTESTMTGTMNRTISDGRQSLSKAKTQGVRFISK